MNKPYMMRCTYCLSMQVGQPCVDTNMAQTVTNLPPFLCTTAYVVRSKQGGCMGTSLPCNAGSTDNARARSSEHVVHKKTAPGIGAVRALCIGCDAEPMHGLTSLGLPSDWLLPSARLHLHAAMDRT